LAVNHQAALLKAFFNDGVRWGVHIDYSLEPEPLGTMGPLKLISDLPDTFLVMNGDILTDLDYGAFVERHKAEGRLFTIAAANREEKIDYGVLEVAGQRLQGFQEKPSIRYLVSMGIYCLSRRVLDFIPRNQPFGFDQLILDLIARHEPVTVEPHSGYWLDIGRPDDYQKAVEEWPVLREKIGLS
jgi:NDP-sugar pyrophosphorylase family protein